MAGTFRKLNWWQIRKRKNLKANLLTYSKLSLVLNLLILNARSNLQQKPSSISLYRSFALIPRNKIQRKKSQGKKILKKMLPRKWKRTLRISAIKRILQIQTLIRVRIKMGRIYRRIVNKIYWREMMSKIGKWFLSGNKK